MSRPPRARESVLDAFEQILITRGEKAATMDATARAAAVSKGGLLYHFGSKEALEAGLIERLVALVDADVAEIIAAGDAAIAHFIRTSVMTGAPLDRAMLAVSRLAQGGSAPASAALHEARRRWADAVRPHVRDETALDLVLLASDGLYFNNLLDPAASGPVLRDAAMNRLVSLLEQLAAR
ncbi:TetR/AcrR family transcriptional regulator [Microbacterium protaetiae]|uniref:TetR/AcrR family transcriptional regulator n=1 Tax=Microbacterium protaetiae TaxID=2509458 RepID=A0A4P6EIL1_9MICO|nr:TetR/AcrR family transcriptional regulator [Microbacterium protaetiae]QAY61099.1 TetR/AcrR family transcriptional regulator [Microbacterium protaetiae]